jgi:hypothetical protein
MIHHQHEQGSDEWLQARRGVITGSRFKDARDKLKSGAPSKAALSYAMDLAARKAWRLSAVKIPKRGHANRYGAGAYCAGDVRAAHWKPSR